MAKTAKMRVVRGKKGQKSSDFSVLGVILSPFTLVLGILAFVWNLIFRFPNQPAYVLGFIRLAFWLFLLWLPDYTELAKYSSNYSRMPEELQNQWLFYWPLWAGIAFFMAVYSFFVMFGLNSNTTTNSSYGEYHNIESMYQFIDGRLSSPGNRSKILKKLFD